MPKDPWMKFYPTDWLADAKLNTCSLAAQGLLIKLMCLMHQSEEPGRLLINGNPPSNHTLYPLCNCHSNTLSKLLDELLQKGVLKTDENGVIYCPRMVRDRTFRDKQREHGKRGGNPALKRQTLKGSLIPICQKPEARYQKEITTEETNMCGLVETDPLRKQAKEVIEYLNEATGSRFRATGKSVDKVFARLREGFTVEDCKQVVDGQKLDPYFLANPKFFRPETLFGGKFEGYLSAAPKQRMALETDPKRMIKDMRAEAEIRRFVGDTEPKRIGGPTNATTGQGGICERSTTDCNNPRDRKTW